MVCFHPVSATHEQAFLLPYSKSLILSIGARHDEWLTESFPQVGLGRPVCRRRRSVLFREEVDKCRPSGTLRGRTEETVPITTIGGPERCVQRRLDQDQKQSERKQQHKGPRSRRKPEQRDQRGRGTRQSCTCRRRAAHQGKEQVRSCRAVQEQKG